jgi:hypothetical protein
MGCGLKEHRAYSFSGTLKLLGYVNSRSKMYWAAENPVFIHDMSLHDITFGVWCAMSAN